MIPHRTVRLDFFLQQPLAYQPYQIYLLQHFLPFPHHYLLAINHSIVGSGLGLSLSLLALKLRTPWDDGWFKCFCKTRRSSGKLIGLLKGLHHPDFSKFSARFDVVFMLKKAKTCCAL